MHLRIGMIGAGWVARNRHLPALTELDHASCAAIWSRNIENAKNAAAEFHIPTVAQSWDSICDSNEIDAVIVATPPALHCAATLHALAAGKHVLCQGRMARNIDEARSMCLAARASGRITGLYPPRPGLKGDRVMRRLIDAGYLGRIREIRVTSLSLAPPSAADDWKKDRAVMGVNAMTLGMWAEVLHRWVGTACRVSAMAAAEAENTVPDSLAIAAEFPDGVLATLHFSDRAAFGPGSSIEIYGDNGALVYKLFAEEMLGASSGATELRSIEIPPDEERKHTTDAEFVSAILDGTALSPTFEDGLRYMEFCEAVARSARTGAAVILPLEDSL